MLTVSMESDDKQNLSFYNIMASISGVSGAFLSSFSSEETHLQSENEMAEVDRRSTLLLLALLIYTDSAGKIKCHDTLFPYAKIQWPGQSPEHFPAAHGMLWLSCK